jgi:hypothetical protein
MLVYNNKRSATISSRKSARVVYGAILPDDISFEDAKHSD